MATIFLLHASTGYFLSWLIGQMTAPTEQGFKQRIGFCRQKIFDHVILAPILEAVSIFLTPCLTPLTRVNPSIAGTIAAAISVLIALVIHTLVYFKDNRRVKRSAYGVLRRSNSAAIYFFTSIALLHGTIIDAIIVTNKKYFPSIELERNYILPGWNFIIPPPATTPTPFATRLSQKLGS